ncbi:hypothetical protein [Acidipropionibacterium jensenii]|uniref:hypothetical protein n=1 Tax=Acidipropionibacterium jensenii TaxID=1749 RepID=UPI00214C5602|nr:hypothetical protein [Acidipropionibacterium jensenii]
MTAPVGMWVILGAGLALLVIAALADRRSRLRAEAELSALPHGRRLPRMSQELCSHVDEILADDHLSIGARLVDRRAASQLSPDDEPTAILEDARVIICPEPLDGARIIQAILMGCPDRADLAIVCPEIDDFALGVALANHLHGARAVVPIIADPADCAQIAETLGSTPTTRAAIRSGWLPAEVWGRAHLVISDALSTTVVPAPADSPEKPSRAN